MFLSIITFLIVLSILVLVHEAGHYFAAKRAGIWVEEFGFGLPPRVWGKKVGETIYSINALPFGGFVRLHGENTDEQVTKPERAFLNKGISVRVGIVVAGVIMNFLLGILAFSISYSFMGIPRTTNEVKVVEIMPDSPAQMAGFEKGDIVKSVNGVPVKTNNEFISKVEQSRGEEVEIVLQKPEKSETFTVKTTPRVNPPEGEGSLGVLISNSETYFPPIWQRPFYGAYYGTKDAFFWSGVILKGTGQIVTNLFSGIVPKDVAGPVGIYALTTQAASYGILTLLNFVGVLSVNLAILNILPFPALDGGRLLFIVIEKIFGRRVVPRVEAAIHTVGIVILIALILVITAHDIQKLIINGGVTGYLNSILK